MKFQCPHCGQKLSHDQATEGESIICPACSQGFRLSFAKETPHPPQKPTTVSSRAWWLAALIGIAAMFGIAHFLRKPGTDPTPAAIKAASESPLPVSGIDMVMFGDSASEATHDIAAEFTETITGGLGEPARRLLPGGPFPWQGGSIAWNMKVDPAKQNYFTVKLWGSDKGYQNGCLILFAEGLQVGYRHEGDHDLLNQMDDDPLAPGRFVYVTLPLPPKLTEGRDTIALRIVSTGPIWFYGGNFEKYQKPFTGPSRGIYRAYTHTSPRFDPSPLEVQGRMPDATFRTTPGVEVIEETRKTVMDRVSRALANPNQPGSAKGISDELHVMSEAWKTTWTPAHRNRKAIERIIRLGDAFVTDFHRDRSFVENDWGGARSLGMAVISTMPDLEVELSAEINAGGRNVSRRAAWAEVLKHSVDHWRARRRAFTNQSMIVDAGI